MRKKDYQNLTKEQLIELLSKQKYGLVWEENEILEKVLNEFKENLPILKEVSEKELFNISNQNTHIIIEGDNFHALSVLNYTHNGKIDLIYIDPPYNTGTKDFKYNDNYVEKEDSWRHSKWLSFMKSRLDLAYDLLKDNGTIFISIDDNELAQLRLLCNDIFGEHNFIENIIWKKRGGPPNDKPLGATHEYILSYAKNKSLMKLNRKERSNKQLDRYLNPDEHPKGLWAPDNLMANVKGGRYVASLHFAIVNPHTGEKHYPGKDGNWRFNQDKVQRLLANDEIYFGKDKKGRPKLKRFLMDVKDGVPFSTDWDYLPHNNSASKEIQDILGNLNIFDTPKPVNLIKEILRLASKKDSIVLDFFAGSGTTMQAVIELNHEDEGYRQCLLVNNNENDIAEKVCYERNKKVIKGYKKANGEKVKGYNANLKFYQTGFVKRSSNLDQIKIDITKECTEMLCLKENIFQLFKEKKNKKDTIWKIFKHKDERYLAVFYDFLGQSIYSLKKEMNKLEGEKILYCFTLNPFGLNEDEFQDWNNIRLEPIPQKILDIYSRIYKKTL